MPSYTLQCGHRHDLTDCIKRASSLNSDRAICHVCKTPFSSVEACYLELVNTNSMTLAEFIQSVFAEVVIAPGFEEGSLEILQQKKS
jgi:hypothetical protein